MNTHEAMEVSTKKQPTAMCTSTTLKLPPIANRQQDDMTPTANRQDDMTPQSSLRKKKADASCYTLARWVHDGRYWDGL